MNQWSPDQLLHAAEAAAESGRLQDAVTVLVYLLQSFPDTPEADRAKLLYRHLTGTDCPDADEGIGIADRTARPTDTAVSQEAALDTGNPAEEADDTDPAAMELPPAPLNGHADRLPRRIATAHGDTVAWGAAHTPVSDGSASGSAAGPLAAAVAVTATAERRDKGRLAELDEEFSFELDERFGRVLAHVSFGLGFLLLPVGLLILVFSLAFAFLLPWAVFALALALPLMGLGQLLRIGFELRGNIAKLAEQERDRSR